MSTFYRYNASSIGWATGPDLNEHKVCDRHTNTDENQMDRKSRRIHCLAKSLQPINYQDIQENIENHKAKIPLEAEPVKIERKASSFQGRQLQKALKQEGHRNSVAVMAEFPFLCTLHHNFTRADNIIQISPKPTKCLISICSSP